MRAILNEKLYDTEKSENVATFERLAVYKTKNGTLFMVNTGIPGVYLESMHSIEQDEIKRFIGEHYPDKYIELFGEVEEA